MATLSTLTTRMLLSFLGIVTGCGLFLLMVLLYYIYRHCQAFSLVIFGFFRWPLAVALSADGGIMALSGWIGGDNRMGSPTTIAETVETESQLRLNLNNAATPSR